jgi:hypothetical protein
MPHHCAGPTALFCNLERKWSSSLGCSLSIPGQNLHYSVFSRQFLFLDPLLFDLFLFRQIGFLPEFF